MNIGKKRRQLYEAFLHICKKKYQLYEAFLKVPFTNCDTVEQNFGKCQLYEGKVGTWRGKSIRFSAHQRAAALIKVSSLRGCSGTIEHWAAWRVGGLEPSGAKKHDFVL